MVGTILQHDGVMVRFQQHGVTVFEIVSEAGWGGTKIGNEGRLCILGTKAQRHLRGVVGKRQRNKVQLADAKRLSRRKSAARITVFEP